MKKEISGFQLGVTFAGCFLGAGYVSGKETWQFFGRYGSWGWTGLFMALFGLGAFGAITFFLVQNTGDERLEDLIIPWDIPFLKRIVSLFSVIFLFGIVSIMTAGTGALFQQIFEIPHFAGSLLFAAAITFFTLTGKEGMVAVFSVIVPFLTIAAVLICMLALAILPPSEVELTSRGFEWVFSSITFAAYNMFSTIAILAPLGKIVKRKSIFPGISVGAGILLLIAGLILLVLERNPEAIMEELPMLSVVFQISKYVGWLFGLLLLLAMFGTGFSCFLTAVNQVIEQFPAAGEKRILSIFVLAALSFLASMCGFGDLISIIYPVFGFCSFLFLICMIVHFIQQLL
ncbi:MAG: hypothetical protein IJ137_10975 [Eubacterium sp.]|nr:hypothetical protein [Eubacterium sp.]